MVLLSKVFRDKRQDIFSYFHRYAVPCRTEGSRQTSDPLGGWPCGSSNGSCQSSSCRTAGRPTARPSCAPFQRAPEGRISFFSDARQPFLSVPLLS